MSSSSLSMPDMPSGVFRDQFNSASLSSFKGPVALSEQGASSMHIVDSNFVRMRQAFMMKNKELQVRSLCPDLLICSPLSSRADRPTYWSCRRCALPT
eukprot:767976-Hanusia_phi.AAC.1